jgi:hypothetical protein
LKDSEKAKRTITIETEFTEFQNRNKKLNQFERKEYEISIERFRAKEEMNFAEEKLKVARLNNLKEIFERVVLIKMIQKKIRIAQTQFETEKNEFELNLISILEETNLIKMKIKLKEFLIVSFN